MNSAKKVDTSKLNLWTRPNSYAGPNHDGYYTLPSECGITRDSDALTRSNYRVALEMLGGETLCACENREVGFLSDSCNCNPQIRVIRDSHWAVGWIEYILVHKDATDKVAILADIVASLDGYPVLDESDFSQEESDEADETFGNNSKYFIREILEYLDFKHPDMSISASKTKELEYLACEIYHDSVSNSGLESAWVCDNSIKQFMRNDEYLNKEVKENRFYKLLKLKG